MTYCVAVRSTCFCEDREDSEPEPAAVRDFAELGGSSGGLRPLTP